MNHLAGKVELGQILGGDLAYIRCRNLRDRQIRFHGAAVNPSLLDQTYISKMILHEIRRNHEKDGLGSLKGSSHVFGAFHIADKYIGTLIAQGLELIGVASDNPDILFLREKFLRDDMSNVSSRSSDDNQILRHQGILS